MTPLLMLFLLALPVCLWLYFGYIPAQRAWRAPAVEGQRSNSEKFGTYGDGFGAVNSLASSLGLAGVAAALILQWRERVDSKKEAAETQKRETDLAMIVALINARSTLMNSDQKQTDIYLYLAHSPDVAHKDKLRFVEFMSSSVSRHAEETAELLYLIEHAQSLVGWPELRASLRQKMKQQDENDAPGSRANPDQRVEH